MHMRKARSFLLGMFLLLLAAVLAPACTSSQSNVSTNPGYQGSYQSASRSRQSSQTTQEEGYPQESYRPPVTLEMVATDTGEMLLGEQYPIVAVVSNPENRDLTYRWTVEDGTFAEVPESMRSEIIGYMQELEQAEGVPESAAQAPTRAGGPESGEAPAGPREGAEPEGISSSGRGGGSGRPTSVPPTPKVEPGEPAQESPSEPAEEMSGEEQSGEQIPPSDRLADAESDDQTAEETEVTPESDTDANESTQASAAALARHAVLGPDERSDEDAETDTSDDTSTEEDTAEPAEDADEEEIGESATGQPADEEHAAEDGVVTDAEQPDVAPSDADTGAEDVAAEVEGEVESQGDLAGEFAGFEPKAGTGRLVEVEEEPAVEEEASSEDLAETEEPPLVEFLTDKPYVLWTPPALGTYTIGLVVMDNKGNELTPLRSFPVTVTEPTPTTELVWNTTRKLLEDDYLVVELRARNIPVFDKGLFTVNFDPTTLSFKIAEPGSFFPEGYHTSVYFAQPPGAEGKVTIAIAAEEVGLPKGDGVIARAIFKVKDNVDEPSSLDISEATGTDARYILNPQQENVLPLATSRPVFATEWVEPPAAPQQTRPGTQTREQAPEAPAPPAAEEEEAKPPRPTFGGGTTGTAPSQGEETEESSTSSEAADELGAEDEGTPMVEIPGGVGEPSVEEHIAMLEQQKARFQEDPHMTEQEKAEAIAQIEADIAKLKAGETL